MADLNLKHAAFLLSIPLAAALSALVSVAPVAAGFHGMESALLGCVGQPDGTACDDGNACTTGETCRSGNCLAPTSFAAGVGSPITVGSGPHAVVTRDFNGDGKLDLAVANTANSNNVMILLGNGSGGFTQALGSPVPVGNNPYGIAAGDVNGDGRTDLAVANFGADSVTILLGNGAGGFNQAAGSPVSTGDGPFSIAAGDLNGDGRLDLVVPNFLSSNVSILLGNGFGGFSPAAGSPIAAGARPSSAAVGDLDLDGKADLAVANDSSGDVSILLGNGDGTFSQAAGSPIAVGTFPQSIVAADLNRDGRLDLAVANQAASSNSVSILLGNGAGGFAQPSGSPFFAGTNPDSIAVGDLNGDDILDLAVADAGVPNAVTVLLGNGSGGFAQPAGSPFPAGQTSRSVAVGDVTGDGNLDLVVANASTNDVSILINTTTSAPDGTTCEDGYGCTVSETCKSGRCLAPATFVNNGTASVRARPYSVATGDINLDSNLDIVVPNENANNVTILLGNGAGGFSSSGVPDVNVGNRPQSVAIGRWNGDPNPDLAVANRSSGTVWILLGDGLGGFAQAAGSPITVPGNPSVVVAGEMSGDGILDLAVARAGVNTVSILLGNGSGGFSQIGGWPVGSNPSSLAAADLNGDGKLDLVTSNDGSNDVAVLIGNGAGAFTPGPTYAVGSAPASVAVGDLNADGKLDLAVANSGSSNVSILLGNGTGGFGPSGVVIATGFSPAAVVIRDLNGDGVLDLAVANNGSNTVSVFLGIGGAKFIEATGSPLATGFGPIAIAASDWNGNGKPDLAVVNHAGDNVTIFLNSALSAPDGTACSDGNACTTADACANGSCSGGPPQGCDDANACTTDSCNPATGCTHVNNPIDADADGHFAIACGGDDCDDSQANTFPGASELNDGLDNQCSGNPGSGAIDEISGTSGFTDPSNENRFCWTPQGGATSYQVAKSTHADFTTDCVTATVTDVCLVDPFVPPLGQGFFYVVRALAPHVGSWGLRSNGTEIVVPCAP